MGGTETYLKTQQVADALGLSVSTIKRWVDAGMLQASRTVGKHRLIPLSEAIRFARREKFPLDNLLALAGESAIDERAREQLTEALKQGRAHEARALIAAVHGTGCGAVVLADHLIRPVMERVGQGWKVGVWDVYHEHQASLIISSELMDLIARATRSVTSSSPLALGASPEGDPYILPGLLGELVLREAGWEVRHLGPNLPLGSLAQATLDYRPRLVFLSVSYLADRARFLQEYSRFFETASQAGAAVILGGRALDPDLRAQLADASFGDRMAHLAEFARRLAPAAGSTHPSN